MKLGRAPTTERVRTQAALGSASKQWQRPTGKTKARELRLFFQHETREAVGAQEPPAVPAQLLGTDGSPRGAVPGLAVLA